MSIYEPEYRMNAHLDAAFEAISLIVVAHGPAVALRFSLIRMLVELPGLWVRFRIVAA